MSRAPARTGRRLLALTLLAATAGSWMAPSRAAAAGVLGLVSESFNVAAKGSLLLTASLPADVTIGDPASFTVVVTAYRHVDTRVAVADAIAGRLPRGVDSVDLAGETVIKGRQLQLKVPLEIDTRTREALQLTQAGVYPLTVELIQGGNVLADLLTFVHRLPTNDEPPEDALQVAMAVSAPMDVTVDDNIDVTLDPATLTSLGRLADVLEASSVPMSVRMPPAIIAALAEGGTKAAALGARLSAAAQPHDLLSSPELPLDVSLAAAAGQQELYTQWLRDGEDSLSSSTASPSQRTITLVDQPLSTAGGALLRDLGARLLVLTPTQYDKYPSTLGGYTDSTLLVQISVAPDVTVDASIIDRRAQLVLGQPTTTPQLTSVYLVADLLAARQQIADDGSDPRRHGITLGTPSLDLPSPDLLKPLTALMAETPGLRPTTLDDLSVRTDRLLSDGAIVVVGLPDTVPGDINARIDLTTRLALQNASTSSMLPDSEPRVSEWKHLVSSLPTSAIDTAQATRIATRLDSEFASVRRAIEPPAGFSFNLTGGGGSVPVTIRNSSVTPLKVRVRMSSSKLIFPDGDQLVTVAPESFTEVRIPMATRSNGSFPVTLDVFTPLGDVRLGTPVPLTAHVRGISGLGNLVTGAALLVLLTWWIRHVRRNRRRRAAVKASDRHPATGGVDGDHTDADHTGLSPDAATSTLPPS
jgi:hypothetical protein